MKQKQKQELEKKLKKAEEKIETKNQTKEENELDELIEKFLKFDNPDKIFLYRLINKIEIDKDKNIYIYFNFSKLNSINENLDEFLKIEEILKKTGQKLAFNSVKLHGIKNDKKKKIKKLFRKQNKLLKKS